MDGGGLAMLSKCEFSDFKLVMEFHQGGGGCGWIQSALQQFLCITKISVLSKDIGKENKTEEF